MNSLYAVFKSILEGEVSKRHSLPTESPQGPVLSPPLFSVYTMQSAITCTMYNHALPWFLIPLLIAMLMIPSSSYRSTGRTHSVSSDLLMTCRYLGMDQRTFNFSLSNTEFLVIPASFSVQQQISIQLESGQLMPSKSARNLGVMINEQLTFSCGSGGRAVVHQLENCRFDSRLLQSTC